MLVWRQALVEFGAQFVKSGIVVSARAEPARVSMHLPITRSNFAVLVLSDENLLLIYFSSSSQSEEEAMSVRSTFLAGAALIVTPAVAAEFLIVQDTKTQTCAITQEVPKGDDQVVVGDGAYGDEAAAASDMRKMLVCNPRDASPDTTPQSPAGLKT